MEKNMELEEAIERLTLKATTSSADAPDYPNCIVMKKDLITILNHITKQEKMIELIEKECRQRLAFAKGIRRREKRNPDDFNQGLEFESATIMNLLSGEPHWEYEGQYFDDIDKQVEKLKAEESKQMINNIKDIEQICKQID